MRISVIKDDPGFRFDAHMFEVYVNGKHIKNCYTADEELGIAYIYDNGALLTNKLKTKLIEKELSGTIKIKLRQ